MKFLCLVLFCFTSIRQVSTRYKMNKIVNMFLLTGDKFMPEMHLRQPGCICSACGPLIKNEEIIKNWKKQEIQDMFVKTN